LRSAAIAAAEKIHAIDSPGRALDRERRFAGTARAEVAAANKLNRGTPCHRNLGGIRFPGLPNYTQRACFVPIASAMIAVTRLLMLTPSFSACFVSFE